jgi:hypothetical protein
MYNMEIKIGSYSVDVRMEILFLMVIMLWVIGCHLFFSCTYIGVEEGFEIAKQLVGCIKENNVAYTSQFSQYQSVWSLPNTNPRSSVSPAKNLAVSNDISDINTPFNNPPLPIKTDFEKPYQLPPGEMDILAVTTFKPECCPNLYSNSKGCACPTEEQYQFIKQRGNNNVPVSEY